ncbi:hypothetical protein CWE09_00500 [Aliidiomarina minuta]|uniref:Transcriptional regulator n=1 Tax=Aliidiomarina minuta TaxID=880057 RepID=A0A432W5C1_9GAMM|nr:hypothetical protein [Aliidiomarina minuta]RUO25257.1 hypothetical protein CWE09_00500 [Aliidiomarina minuta]
MTNKTQQGAKIKLEEPSLDEYMERLGQLAGERKVAGILRWMDASPSSYANWRRRGTIPYKTIVNALLRRRLSLDWFFSPYMRLDIPSLPDAHVSEGLRQYAAEHVEQPDSELVIKAFSQCQALLKRYNVTPSEEFLRMMLDMYFSLGEGQTERVEVLEHLARSLAKLESDLPGTEPSEA